MLGISRLTAELAALAAIGVRRRRSVLRQGSDPVFATVGRGGGTGGGWRLGHRNVQRRAWDQIRAALDLPEKVTFHQLRHAFAGRAHSRGVELQDLSMVMGHSSVDITAKTYVHLYGREQGRGSLPPSDDAGPVAHDQRGH